MSKCYKCGATQDLFQNDWAKQKRYLCTTCSLKPSKFRAVAELPTAPEAWLKLARENHLRLAAKYAK